MDLEPFQRINPCGYEGLVVTQLRSFSPVVFSEVESRLVDSITAQLGYSEVIRSNGERGMNSGIKRGI
jgi:lipoyl(octanoyl) transferase